METEKIIKEKKGTIIDVRTPVEFMGGHVKDSINIPLRDIPKKINEVKDLAQPIVLCCASGNRSGQAYEYLSQQGINCVNGGSWLNVNHLTSQTNS